MSVPSKRTSPELTRHQAGDDAGDRGLAGAVAAEQRDDAVPRRPRTRRRRARGTVRSRRRRRAAPAAARRCSRGCRPSACRLAPRRRRRARVARRASSSARRGRPVAPRRRSSPRPSGLPRSACRSRARRGGSRTPAPSRRRARRAGWRCRARAAPRGASARAPASRAGRGPTTARRASSSCGSVISARPSSTSRARPRLSASIRRSATSSSPSSCNVRSTRSHSSSVGLGQVEAVLPQAAGPEAGALGDEQVVANGHPAEELDPLERATEAEAGALVDRATG